VANGKVHSLTSAGIGLVGAGYASLALRYDITVCGQFALGGVAAVALSPDLDCPGGYIFEGLLRKIPVFGRVLSGFWFYYWFPYRVFVGLVTKRAKGYGDSHRSWISHLPAIGTILRLFWILLPYEIALLWFGQAVYIPPIPFMIALVICDFAHSVLDSVQWV
jgi:hypothetical protein